MSWGRGEKVEGGGAKEEGGKGGRHTLLRLLSKVLYSSRTSCSRGETAEGAEDVAVEGAVVGSAISMLVFGGNKRAIGKPVREENVHLAFMASKAKRVVRWR